MSYSIWILKDVNQRRKNVGVKRIGEEIFLRLQSRASFWILAKKSETPRFRHVERNDDKHHGRMSVIITTGTLLYL